MNRHDHDHDHDQDDSTPPAAGLSPDDFIALAMANPMTQGRASYGYAMRVASDNPAPPGVIALTWITGKDAGERQRIRDHARQNVADFLDEPGFLSIVTGFIGLRGFTVTAWQDEASMQRALSRHHAEAMRELFGEDFIASVWTSVWRPGRLNRLWVRCTECAHLQADDDNHRRCSTCGAELPPRPAYW